jgi:hypothetical protein
MRRSFLNQLTRPVGRPRPRRRRTRLGCLLWILVVIVVVVLLSLFGSFQKGTKAGGGLPALRQPAWSVPAAAPAHHTPLAYPARRTSSRPAAGMVGVFSRGSRGPGWTG